MFKKPLAGRGLRRHGDVRRRQTEGEGRPLALGGLDPYVAPVVRRDVAND